MTPKEFLQQAYKLDRRVKLMYRKIEQLRAVLNYSPPSLSGASGSGSDRMPDTLSKIMENERRAEELTDLYVRRYIEITEAISEVPDEVQREILERRYLLYQPWSSHTDPVTGSYIPGIAEDMGYTLRHIYRLHGIALRNIRIPKDVTKCH
jgi:hypothetical protein